LAALEEKILKWDVQVAAQALRSKTYKKTHRSFGAWLKDSGLDCSKAAAYYAINGRSQRIKNDPLVYFLRCKQARAVKVGHSTWLDARLETIRIGCPLEIEVIGTIAGGKAEENRLHRALDSWRIRGEWFYLNAFTERIIQEALNGKLPD
jgi:hypothetical protein